MKMVRKRGHNWALECPGKFIWNPQQWNDGKAWPEVSEHPGDFADGVEKKLKALHTTMRYKPRNPDMEMVFEAVKGERYGDR